MTELVLFRRSPGRDDPRQRRAPRPVLACRWAVCPSTGMLTCAWELVAADPAIDPKTLREREQPPSDLRLAA